MKETAKKQVLADGNAVEGSERNSQSSAASAQMQRKREWQETRRWWIKLFVQPVLLLASGVAVIVGLGMAQKLGFISAGGDGNSRAMTANQPTRYICPMMCTPPQAEAGRCPVCAMELVPATAGGGDVNSHSIRIDAAARRVANIRTVAVKSMPMTRRIRAVGKLSYDEGTLKTLSAYVDGRLDQLYADYTGVVVNKGDHLALVYSPLLYSSQVELLLAKKARAQRRASTRSREMGSEGDLYDSARQRLIELGMTERQIDQLEQAAQANSRMHLCAPISGTVIEKFAVEGQYVKEGQAIYTLADLSTVWLMLELFPEDAAAIHYGQKVEAVVQSLPARTFTGRVAFIDPTVDSRTRTVGVRVVVANPDALLRVGDFAKATIEAPVSSSAGKPTRIYDPELANKWISPRHPHVVTDSAGDCPECGVGLVPAAQFGFTGNARTNEEALVVPHDAVLMAGDSSVVYVETEAGRFEIRRVVLGPSCGDKIAVLSGVEEGEQVATRGNFLIDSQMQLSGNPSLIDPTKAEPLDETLSEEVIAAFAGLSPEDRQLAEMQRICPVTKLPLGTMGTPPKVQVAGQTVFLCCKGCEARLIEEPQTYLANLTPTEVSGDDEDERAISVALSKLTPSDRALAERQRICPVADMRLGSMGTPQKVDVNGTPVFICCEGCRGRLLREPDRFLAKLGGRDAPESASRNADMDLPPIGVPEAIEPHDGPRPIGLPQPIIEEPVRGEQQSESKAGAVAELPLEVVR